MRRPGAYLFREPDDLKMERDVVQVLREASDLRARVGRRATRRTDLAGRRSSRAQSQI
jgi:hypothetical protein